MLKIAFLLGRPGSGKSTAARLIQMLAHDLGWLIHSTNDYEHLEEMFLQEEKELIPSKERKFSPSGPPEYNGFDVKDFSVLDTVLETMAEKVQEEKLASSAEEKKLYLIEFARKDYSCALQKFGDDLLQDAHLLYLDAGVETCIDRVRKRVDCQPDSYNHFVSENIMRNYYGEDDWSDQFLSLPLHGGMCVKAIKIDNSASIDDLKCQVEQIVKNYLIPQLQPV